MGIKTLFSAINKFDDQYMRPLRSVMFAGTLAASGWAAMQANQNAGTVEKILADVSEIKAALVDGAANLTADVKEKLEECDGNLACQASVLRGGQSDGNGATGDFSNAVDPVPTPIIEDVEEKPTMRERALDFLNRD